MTDAPYKTSFDYIDELTKSLKTNVLGMDPDIGTMFEKPTPTEGKPRSEPERVYYQPARPVPGQSGPLAGLTFTARAVLQLAPDLDIGTPEMMYTAVWAPAVAADMASRDSQAAFLSRHTLAETTGLDGVQAMAPGGVVERAARTVGIVRMVERGVPGAIPLEDGEWRGQATSWTVTRPLEEFTHTPARIGEPPHALPVGRGLQDLEVDPAALIVWLDPRHPWWAPAAAGATGLRAVAALITRFGWADIRVSSADLVAMLGIHRQTAWRVLNRLTDLGIALPLGKRGRWQILLASHLGRLAYDDVKHNQRRPSAPNLARERVHNWSWFTSEGRSVRSRARRMVEEGTQTWDFPGNMLRLDRRTGRPWGLVIWIIEQIRRYTEVAHKAARAAVEAFLSETGHQVHRPAPAPRKAPRSRSRPPAAPQAPAAPRPPEPEPPRPTAEQIREFDEAVRQLAIVPPRAAATPAEAWRPPAPEAVPTPPGPAPRPEFTDEEKAAAAAAFDEQIRSLMPPGYYSYGSPGQ